jgi:hypothetical protein
MAQVLNRRPEQPALGRLDPQVPQVEATQHLREVNCVYRHR